MENSNAPEQVTQIKSEIIDTAKKMIENRMDLIEGCRKITRLQYKLDSPDDAFLTLRGIASEADDIPIGQIRNTYTPEALARLDAEKEEYLATVKNFILDACKRIVDIL